MSEQLSKVYEPKVIEQQANELWNSKPYFHAQPPENDQKAYTIVIPPPNVTAPLHLGHALNNTLQDILIRFRRMQKYSTLWMPGTDHAGIATQTVVEKRILSEEGKKRTDFEREEFVSRVQAWKDEYEVRIIEQLKAMGCSCDWDRTRFTMDEVCAKAVRATFFKLFKDGLIYRGKRLVNWDPATQTVLADDEVEHETVQGHFWYMRYPLENPVEIPRGMGFQPMLKTEYSYETNIESKIHGQDAHDTNRGMGFQPMQNQSLQKQFLQKRFGSYLPHWTKSGGLYAVTFRLADSMPNEVLEQWKIDRKKILLNAESQGRELTKHEQQELAKLYNDKVESYLNAGHGQCYLREPQIAELTSNALKHFDGERYDLIAWVIMPNHVHAVLKPYDGFELSSILHSWKSYTSTKANELLGRTGDFWQSEYYDHIIRDEKDFYNQLNYILSNPEKAELENWLWINIAEENHGQDAHDTIEYVTVATTRPETMLGDTAVAMNPRDPRAKFLVGKKVRLPIVGRMIPIIADEHVVLPDPNSEDEKAKFSTGFLKVTPAHDPDDYAIGQRHDLDIINIMAPDGSISDKFGWEDATEPEAQNLLGMDRFEAREAIVEWFRQEKLLEDVRDYAHEVGHSYRSHVPIEPYLSDQWYIAVKKPISSLVARDSSLKEELIKGTDVPVNSLAGLALKPLIDKRLRFIPERYEKTYQTWLENLRDWPISRQLWWGHRIPIWHKRVTLTEENWTNELLYWGWDSYTEGNWKNEDIEIYIVRTSDRVIVDPKIDALMPIVKTTEGEYDIYVCGIDDKTIEQFEFDKYGFKQDTDVLDTWFSSALWPFSTLGWPEDTTELKSFYPGNVLCTAREIITLWVSRMVMMGQYCAGDIPFSDVYIHAMIQDGQGRKMSKSLGNGIDPLVAIDSHGADAMRFTLADMTTDTQDIRMPVSKMTLPDGRVTNTSAKFDVGRNFCNKLWNASRFAMMNLEGTDPSQFDASKMDITDKWILSRLARTVSEVTESLENFRFNEPLSSLYKFFWNDFCDWYLEWTKPRMQNEDKKPIAQNVLAFVLDQVLRMLHPFVPFITEGIFQKLNEIAPVRKLEGIANAESADALVAAKWPELNDSLINEQVENNVTIIQNLVRAIRDIENKYNVNKAEEVSANANSSIANLLNENAELICLSAYVQKFSAGEGISKPENAATAIVEDIQVFVHNVVDVEAEKARLQKQKEQVENAKKGTEAKLSNENFVSRAKPEVVAQAREKLVQLTEQLETIVKHLSELEK
ncbi:MAG: valine--tRNA ligase [Sedimentisphaerales bacterium]|nr:valine--tRNA ligase [Sedimentisphaerales bacterium]